MSAVASLPATFDGRRTVPSPEVTQKILAALALGPPDKVLEIGTGSGYQTQELAKTGAEVHSVELEPWIDPTKVLGECVYLHQGDGRDGLAECAPFTAIMASCGVEDIPGAWMAQLADGGRLVAPVGLPEAQRLVLYRKRGVQLIPERILAYVRFQMLREPPKPKPPKYNPYD